ncbi:MAG: DUF3450 domain-containing protein [Candidatus Krumholzibacteriia bacterium]
MNSNRMAYRGWFYALAAFLAATGEAWAQTGQEAREAVDQAVEVRQQTQQGLDAWAEEKDDLLRRFRQAQASVEWLEERQGVEQQRVLGLEGRIAELERRLGEADRLEGSLQDTLQVLFHRLEDSVSRSLPFLPGERRFRLETLRDELSRPDIASAEKLRRLLEALQVEAAYGATAEVYQGEIEVAGETIFADILRLGRVALFWMTPDRKQAGTYDQGEGAWLALADGGARRRIGLAMEMASRLRPVELIELPLGRIAPAAEAQP